jgi:hypothetical protein
MFVVARSSFGSSFAPAAHGFVALAFWNVMEERSKISGEGEASASSALLA